MKTAEKVIIAAVCAAVAASGTFGGYKYNQIRKKNKAIVDVTPVSNMSNSYWGDNLELQGTVSSGDVQKIMQDESQLVFSKLFKKGDAVKKGDTILKYDMTLLELDAAQKKNDLAVIDDNINQANKEIRRLQNLKPSEAIPPMPEPTEPPTQPRPTVQTVKAIKDTSNVISGNGSADDPFIFNCSGDTVVSASFLNHLRSSKSYADFYIYENDILIYAWKVNGSDITEEQTEDWTVGKNVIVNGNGSITVDFSKKVFGTLQTYSTEDDYPQEQLDNSISQSDYEQSYIKSGSDDYIYSKAEIAKMISDKQDEIKKLELDKKSADIAYRQALNKKESGQVKSSIDGIVTEVNMGTENADSTSPLVVIQGSAGLSVTISIGELNLDKIAVGDIVNITSYDTGAMAEAEITSIDMTPVSYTSENWNENPNSSTYSFKAKITEDTEGFSVGNWVGATISEAEENGSLYIPLHYTRELDGKYYVMKSDDNGKLKKQYIKTGKIIYGNEIEIKGGLSNDDTICFPYGKNVKEGVKTRVIDEVKW